MPKHDLNFNFPKSLGQPLNFESNNMRFNLGGNNEPVRRYPAGGLKVNFQLPEPMPARTTDYSNFKFELANSPSPSYKSSEAKRIGTMRLPDPIPDLSFLNTRPNLADGFSHQSIQPIIPIPNNAGAELVADAKNAGRTLLKKAVVSKIKELAADVGGMVSMTLKLEDIQKDYNDRVNANADKGPIELVVCSARGTSSKVAVKSIGYTAMGAATLGTFVATRGKSARMWAAHATMWASGALLIEQASNRLADDNEAQCYKASEAISETVNKLRKF